MAVERASPPLEVVIRGPIRTRFGSHRPAPIRHEAVRASRSGTRHVDRRARPRQRAARQRRTSSAAPFGRGGAVRSRLRTTSASTRREGLRFAPSRRRKAASPTLTRGLCGRTPVLSISPTDMGANANATCAPRSRTAHPRNGHFSVDRTSPYAFPRSSQRSVRIQGLPRNALETKSDTKGFLVEPRVSLFAPIRS